MLVNRIGYKFAVTIVILFNFVGLFNVNIYSEGSKDFVDYPGYRLFYYASRDQQLKVYAGEGEFINVGASHVGIAGGYIEVYKPDGSLFTKFDNSGATQGIGIINNYLEELAGPTGGGNTMGAGYIPGVVQVAQGDAGVWTILMRYPLPTSETNFANVLNNAHWYQNTDQPTNKRVVLAWDVTVSQGNAGNMGGEMVDGRLYSNELLSIVSKNGFTTSPKYYILTKDGIKYEVQYNDVDPWGFPIYSNSWGIIKNGQPIYESSLITPIIRSDDPSSWNSTDIYLYDPQGPDSENFLNNKIFINLPDPNMPSVATVTDVLAVNPITYSTWLFSLPTVNDVDFDILKWISINPNAASIENAVNLDYGGYLLVNSTTEATIRLSIDLNADGDYSDPEDRIIYDRIHSGLDSIFWDAKDGLGNTLPESASLNISYDIRLTSGEIHILMDDIENDLGGVDIIRLNGVNAPDSTFYFDHRPIDGDVSGNGSVPAPTTQAYTFNDSWGNEKTLDYWTFSGVSIKQDTQVVDIYSGPIPTLVDSDGDGIVDPLDLDDDNDGILDQFEYCNSGFDCLPNGMNPSGDDDNDGIANYKDADDPNLTFTCVDVDNDGICDQILPIFDTDGDQIPNYLDLDSDNDGISDLKEAGHNQLDSDNNGKIDGLPVDFGANGLFNQIATNPDDFLATVIYTLGDADNDAVFNFLDLDSDNDGIHDVIEGGNAFADVDNNGRIDVGVNEYGQLLDVNNDIISSTFILDTDNDGIFNYIDLDSDNDGIHDVIEGGNAYADADNNGRIDANINENGQVLANDNSIVSSSSVLDNDTDGKFNYIDLDSDNDGIHDVIEGGNAYADADDNGRIDANTNYDGQVLANDNSIVSSSLVSDHDADGIFNYIDLDSDNDGIHDVIEGGNADIDANGRLDQIATNQDGQVVENGVQISTSDIEDTDNDSVFDYIDLDSDNDGIHDVIEGGYADEDNDGIIGLGQAEINIDGQAILNGILLSDGKPQDTDNDGIYDFRNLDSDADGIHDVIEGGNEDYNGNGEVGGDDEPVDSNGNPVAANDNPTPDTDGDGIPDSMELDSDNDGLSDSNECPGGSPCRDLDNDGKKDFQDVDRDGDGIEDQYECPDGDSADCLDTDNDDLPDIDDLDSDNDGLSDRVECPDGYECPDTDGDGIPNYLDTDSDGDGLSDTNECPDGVNCPDSDGDGIPNYLDSDCAIVIETPVLLVNNPVCEGEDIILSLEDPSSIENAFPNNEIVFIWKNGNGDLLPLFTSVDHILKTDDLKAVSPYTVLAYVGNCPSDVSNAVDVVVTPLVEANIIVPDTAVCQGSNVLLIASPVDGASYSWVNLNNNEEISTTPFVDINNIDETINVQLTMQIEGCESTDSDMVEVSLHPNPVIASVSDDGLYCEGDVVVLSAEIVDTSDPVTFTWTGPNNFEFSGSSMSEFNTIINNISLNQSGNYQLQLESLEGCLSDPMNVEVAVQPTSSPAIFASENVICEGGNLEIRTDSISGVVVYQWLKNGIPLDTTNVPFLNINSSIDGKYSVLVESSACTSDVSAEVEVEMIQSNIETNILNIATELSPICEGENIELSIINPNPEVLYQWFDANDNLLNEGISLIFNEIQKENEGSYFVKGTINGCEIPEANTEVFVVNQTMIQPIIDDNSLVICEGLNLELNISNPIDIDSTETIEYVWYYNGNQIETTNEPSLMLNALTSSQSGNYSVVVSSSGCMGIESENVVVVVNDVPDDVIALVGEDNRICNESSFLLTAQPLTNGSGYWTAIDGGNINDVTSDTTSVSGLSEGVYHFVWTIDYESCIGLDSDTLTLNVGEANEIAKTEDDRKICISDVDNVILNATQPTIGTGQWEQISGTDVVISNPNNSNTEISDLSLGEYAFVWTLSDGDCIDYSVDTIHVLVKDIPDEVATIYDDYWESCSPNQVTISAEVPTESTGYWEVLNEGEILSESSPGTVVSGLANGENILIWKLVDDACGEFSQDTMKIKVFDMVLPEDDSFTVIVGDTIDESVTGNDFIGNVETVNYGIYIAPEHGTVSIASNGSFKYIPEEGYFGEDLFVYSMTNVFCGQQELAKVRIRIQNNIDPNVCNIPNLITPNGDQSNDFLMIDCAPVLPENHLVIFNRWGDKIFEAAPYLNDWNGQLKGDKLPSGTYYYIFKRHNLDSTPKTGYISILR